MIKTILFIIVIAIIAYFIYRSFSAAKLKGGDPGISDEKIWEIVDHVIKYGDYGSKYIPFNYDVFSYEYKRYLMFEYAKGINAYHKKYDDFIKFDNVDNVSDDYDCEAYKYTSNNVELTILASENDNGDIESCYMLRVKCDDFMETDSNASISDKRILREAEELIQEYKDIDIRHSNNMARLDDIKNQMTSDYEAGMRVGLENLNNSNSDIGPRMPIVTDETLRSLGDSTNANDDNSTTKRPIIEPVMNANENTNLNNNNDVKEKFKTFSANLQKQEKVNKILDALDTNISINQTSINEEQDKKEDLANDNIQTTEDEKKLIEVFKRAAKYIRQYNNNGVYLSSIMVQSPYNTDSSLNGALKATFSVLNAFKKFNTNNEYKIEYSERYGWKIIRNDEASNLNNQTTEQTKFENQSNDIDKNYDAEKELIELFNKIVRIMEDHEYREYNLSTLLLSMILSGENVGKLQQTLRNEDFVREKFKKINTDDKYRIEYNNTAGWTIKRNNEY